MVMDDKQLMGFITPTLEHYKKGKWTFDKDADKAILKAVKATKHKTDMDTLKAITAAVEAAGKHG